MVSIYLLLDVVIAFILDLLFGDPYWLPHPVRFIGWLIKNTERLLRKLTDNAGEKKETAERNAGVVLTAFVVIATSLLVLCLLKLAGLFGPAVFHIVNVYFIYSALACKCLSDEAYKVYYELAGNNLPEARKKLAMLVGRQTENLSEKEVIRGVVETTAENTVDGIITPLFYAFLGSLIGFGAPLVYAFKAVSTLDSMVGYMNERYINFGRASAKLDDAANYIPARLSGLLIPLGAMFYGKSFSKSFSVMKRDRRKHKSPNCAYPEAAVAGALGIRIGGTNIYFGQAVEKPTIGDPLKELEPGDIKSTIGIMYSSSTITVVLGLLASIALLLLFGGRA